MTKKNLFFCAGSLMLAGCANEFDITASDVPPAVIAAFQQKYPSAKVSEWEVEKADGHLMFSAEFKLDGKNKQAGYKPDGTFVEEE